MNRLMILLMFVTGATTGADSDLVNERLTTSGPAMEAHWGVDCRATLRALTTPIAQVGPDMHSTLTTALTKCRFIYQPPGGRSLQTCTDYTALLQAWQKGNNAALKTVLAQSVSCSFTLENNLDNQ